MYVSRSLSLGDLSRAVFLFGPRQTGKTTLLGQQFPAARWYNLLETDAFFRLSARPRVTRDEIASAGIDRGTPVIIDEIQKLPVLLGEVQLLIDRDSIPFVLTGSSARRLFPLTSGEFRDLGALDLQQEIQQEGIVRRIDAFSRFLRTAATMNTELVNFEAVASDPAVPARTVREYFEVLSDTLIAEVLEPYRRGAKRKAIVASATPSPPTMPRPEPKCRIISQRTARERLCHARSRRW